MTTGSITWVRSRPLPSWVADRVRRAVRERYGLPLLIVVSPRGCGVVVTGAALDPKRVHRFLRAAVRQNWIVDFPATHRMRHRHVVEESEQRGPITEYRLPAGG